MNLESLKNKQKKAGEFWNKYSSSTANKTRDIAPAPKAAKAPDGVPDCVAVSENGGKATVSNSGIALAVPYGPAAAEDNGIAKGSTVHVSGQNCIAMSSAADGSISALGSDALASVISTTWKKGMNTQVAKINVTGDNSRIFSNRTSEIYAINNATIACTTESSIHTGQNSVVAMLPNSIAAKDDFDPIVLGRNCIGVISFSQERIDTDLHKAAESKVLKVGADSTIISNGPINIESNGYCMAYGNQPLACGEMGSVITLCRTEHGVPSVVKTFRIDGINYKPDVQYTLNTDGIVVAYSGEIKP